MLTVAVVNSTAIMMHCMYVLCVCNYHTSNSCECMGVNGKGLQLSAVNKKPYIFTASHVKIRISTTSHVIIIITIVPSYTGKKYHSFVAVGIVTHAVHS